ncbi:MAG TPA: lysine--tRNA ligase [Nitrososphaeraceae archaeon]|nr:lysine--tRNA ligase [Nitrososphaeraceae archaeon]
MSSSEIETIGKGTWIDKIADSLINRERVLGRPLTLLKVESGLGASGVPHIGSMADAVRSYGVSLALRNLGYRSELIAYSDDMDGLRKVPSGFPPWLNEYLAKPVSTIPDPEGGCHRSYADHMTDSLLKGLQSIGVSYSFHSATDAYRKGVLIKQIDSILRKGRSLGRKIASLVGQDKFVEVLPYFPICESCGRLYLARAEKYYVEQKKVSYSCIGSKIGNSYIKGCGHSGESDISKGQGKLAWKVEFAARWAAFDIRFEAFGKDIMDSVRVNDWVSNEVLAFPHPLHVKYELFLDRTGKKISKSSGNVFTPQHWLRYGSPESLMLLFFKRIVGTRTIGLEEIPALMNEYDLYEDLYFGKVREDNKAKLIKLKGIYEYINHLRPPKYPDTHIPFDLLVQYGSLFPLEERVEKVFQRLVKYNMAKEKTPGLIRRISLASNWIEDKMSDGRQISNVSLGPSERRAVDQLVGLLSYYSGLQERTDIPGILQTKIFEIARSNNILPKDFFKLIYRILLNEDKGPKLGNYVVDLGIERTCEILMENLKRS